MIVSVSVSNFRSFFAEETFSLTASNKLWGSHDDHVVAIPNSDQRVLRIGVIYGANGAGKSNLFKALHYAKSIALGRRELGTARTPFRLGGDSAAPSTIDLQFIAGKHLYRFGFKADDSRISEEWLVEVIDSREKILYERATTVDGKVTVDAPGLKGISDKLSALITVGGLAQQSFLATVHLTLNQTDYGEHLENVLGWFRSGLQLIGPDAPFGGLARYLADNPECSDFAGAFLRSVSTGVDHLDVSKKELSEDDLHALVPDRILPQIVKTVTDGPEGRSFMRLPDGTELLIERGSEKRFYRISVRAAHRDEKGTVVPFELNEESDGTRRLLNLMPALHQLYKDATVFFIDEIDRSLHPNLVWEFVHFFLKSSREARAQVILTTHESGLLDLDLLRRDEIWFAEKDPNSATRLYSLTDFSVRKDLEIRKHYLNGRFGAVPFLGDVERLLLGAGSRA